MSHQHLHHQQQPTIANISLFLREVAYSDPYKRAVLSPMGEDASGNTAYTQWTYEQLEKDSDSIARGFVNHGIQRGTRVLVMVRPSLDFVSLSFALFKVGAVPILIDPGMGLKNMLTCIRESEPEAFIGIPRAHKFKHLFPGTFKSISISVRVGKPGLFGGLTLDDLRVPSEKPFPIAETDGEDLAGIFFTSGSTGIPKGVEYFHQQMVAQALFLKEQYQIESDEIDLPTFPLFILFCPAFGITAVIPDMNPSRPAEVDPQKIVAAIQNQGVSHSFGSPALWNVVSKYCIENDIKLPSIKRILIAGAPVPGSVLKRFARILPHGEVFTPYGATEALPVTSIGSREILSETLDLANHGQGVCVGKSFPGLRVEITKISDQAIDKWSEGLVLPAGQVGEITVKGGVVTRRYFKRPKETGLAKIEDKGEIWHRMGDLGYKDQKGRIWFCGRKKHRVITSDETYYSVKVEGIFNAQEDIWRTALVGIPNKGGKDLVLCVEFEPGRAPTTGREANLRKQELAILGECFNLPIKEFLFCRKAFPVDKRHNAKIERAQLAQWAQTQLKKGAI